MQARRRGVYPGSFNPPTVAHLAIARKALEVHALDVVVWAVSHVALAKESVDRPRFEDRLGVLRAEAADRGWLEVVTTTEQLVADIAIGYDVVIMGADKWAEVHDPRFYPDEEARDRAVASLPTPAVARRGPIEVPPSIRLDIASHLAGVSSSKARAGALDSMSAAARRFDRQTGAWTDPERYERWVVDQLSR